MTFSRAAFLYVGMGYLVEIRTRAGRIMFGPFDTLEGAREYCAGIEGAAVIEAVFDPVKRPRRLVEAGNSETVAAILGEG